MIMWLLSLPFKTIGWIIGGIFSLLSRGIEMLWFIIKHIWLIKAIWVVIMLLVNLLVIGISYSAIARDHSLSNGLGFFPMLFLLVGVPLLVNNYLVDSVLAKNILLPIYLTEFVSLQGNGNATQDRIFQKCCSFWNVDCAFFWKTLFIKKYLESTSNDKKVRKKLRPRWIDSNINEIAYLPNPVVE